MARTAWEEKEKLPTVEKVGEGNWSGSKALQEPIVARLHFFLCQAERAVKHCRSSRTREKKTNGNPLHLQNQGNKQKTNKTHSKQPQQTEKGHRQVQGRMVKR